jgi:membrane-associated phospholipid phosphatase
MPAMNRESIPPSARSVSIESRRRARTPVLLGAAFAFCGLALLMRFVDLPLAIWFHEHVSDTLYKQFEIVSAIGGSPVYVSLALLMYIVSLTGIRFGWACPLACGFERLARSSLFVVATMALGGLIIVVLKKLIARARPEVFFSHDFYGFGKTLSKAPFDSFPSSHTLTAFALAAALGHIKPRMRIPFFLLASVVALARLGETDHFLSDVIAAALIAAAVAAWLAPRILGNQSWPLRAPWRWLAA